MSDKKETKKNFEPSERQASEEEQSGNDPVPRIPSLDSTDQDSTSQSSHQREEPLAGTSTAVETDQPESIVTCAAAVTGIHQPKVTVTSAKTSVPKFVSSIPSLRVLSLSPKKNTGVSQSLQKSGQFVKDAVTAASSFKDAMAGAMTGAMTSATSSVKSVVSSIKGAVRPRQPSPERYSLVEPGSECEPPAKITKKEKDFYCRIDTFVDRETKPKPGGNLTESTSFTSSDAASSLDTDEPTDEQSSPTEETPLLRPDKSSSKEKSPKKEY